MAAFREDEPPKEVICEYQIYKALLWSAPELLRKEHDMPYHGSQKGDVYSFGIILQEIIYKAKPFFLATETPKGTCTC